MINEAEQDCANEQKKMTLDEGKKIINEQLNMLQEQLQSKINEYNEQSSRFQESVESIGKNLQYEKVKELKERASKTRDELKVFDIQLKEIIVRIKEMKKEQTEINKTLGYEMMKRKEIKRMKDKIIVSIQNDTFDEVVKMYSSNPEMYCSCIDELSLASQLLMFFCLHIEENSSYLVFEMVIDVYERLKFLMRENPVDLVIVSQLRMIADQVKEMLQIEQVREIPNYITLYRVSQMIYNEMKKD